MGATGEEQDRLTHAAVNAVGWQLWRVSVRIMQQERNHAPTLLVLTVLALGLFGVREACAQGFIRTFPAGTYSIGKAIKQTSDGGFVLGGYVSDASNADMFLVRTDAMGDTLWTRRYGTTGGHLMEQIELASDGGFWLLGSGSSPGNGSDFHLVRVDMNGDLLWNKIYGGPEDEVVYGSAPTIDGGIVMVGNRSIANSNSRTYAVRTDATGDTLWTRTYDTGAENAATSICATSDGGFVIAGFQVLPAPIYRKVEVIRIDSAGNVLWNHLLDGDFFIANWVEPTTDDGFILTGECSSPTAFLLRMDGNGNMQWARRYAHWESSNTGHCVRQMDDGGFTFSGVLYARPWMMRTDPVGNMLWQFAYSYSLPWRGQLIATADGGLAMNSQRFGATYYDMQLVRTGPDGQAPCAWSLTSTIDTLVVTSSAPPVSVASYGVIGTLVLTQGSGALVLDPCITTSSADHTGDEQTLLYPNPTTGTIKVSGASNMLRADVIDPSGRVLLTGYCERSECTIDVAALTSGTYVLRGTRTDGTVHIGRFAKE